MLFICLSLAPELISALLGSATLLLLMATGRTLRGTTLTAARWWAIGSILFLLSVELIIWLLVPSGGRQVTLRYVAAIVGFCPMMAVLGAKRPQHTAWQLIVFSLWIVLALPAAEAYFVRRGAAVQIHDTRGWFLWVLIAIGCLNYLGTRNGLAVVMAAVAQVMLLGEHLPLWRRSTESLDVSIALGLLLAATLLVVVRSNPTPAADRLDRKWAAFRDRFGTFWSLRVAERFNVQATSQGWPLQLGHYGLQSVEPEIDETDVPRAAEEFLASLLSRFEKQSPRPGR